MGYATLHHCARAFSTFSLATPFARLDKSYNARSHASTGTLSLSCQLSACDMNACGEGVDGVSGGTPAAGGAGGTRQLPVPFESGSRVVQEILQPHGLQAHGTIHDPFVARPIGSDTLYLILAGADISCFSELPPNCKQEICEIAGVFGCCRSLSVIGIKLPPGAAVVFEREGVKRVFYGE